MTLPPLPKLLSDSENRVALQTAVNHMKKYGQQCREDAALRKAAQAVVDRWDTPAWKDAPATADYISELRKALK